MIETTFKEAHSEEWVKQNIADLTNELVIIRKIIPWESIVKQLSKFYDQKKGPMLKQLLLILVTVVGRTLILLKKLKISFSVEIKMSLKINEIIVRKPVQLQKVIFL